jgi:hypothetical protein
MRASRISIGHSAPASGGVITGFVLGVMRRLRWVVTAHDLLALCVGVAREDGGERPNGRVGWPRESRSVAPNSARSCFGHSQAPG